MKKLIFIFLIFIFLISPNVALAANTASKSSAKIALVKQEKQFDNRAMILREFLEEHNSPLISHAEDFIYYADKYDLDWRFVVSICGVESYFGSRIPANSYNGWGWGIYGGNVHNFNSWEDGIETVSKGLRERYMDKWKAENVYEVGSFYAADPNWANKVNNFMNKIDKYSYRNPKGILSLSI